MTYNELCIATNSPLRIGLSIFTFFSNSSEIVFSVNGIEIIHESDDDQYTTFVLPVHVIDVCGNSTGSVAANFNPEKLHDFLQKDTRSRCKFIAKDGSLWCESCTDSKKRSLLGLLYNKTTQFIYPVHRVSSVQIQSGSVKRMLHCMATISPVIDIMIFKCNMTWSTESEGGKITFTNTAVVDNLYKFQQISHTQIHHSYTSKYFLDLLYVSKKNTYIGFETFANGQMIITVPLPLGSYITHILHENTHVKHDNLLYFPLT
jgi:hypothetical protein